MCLHQFNISNGFKAAWSVSFGAMCVKGIVAFCAEFRKIPNSNVYEKKRVLLEI